MSDHQIYIKELLEKKDRYEKALLHIEEVANASIDVGGYAMIAQKALDGED